MRPSLISGVFIGVSLFFALVMQDSEAFRRWRMAVLRVDNYYEVCLIRWNAVLSLTILSSLVLVSWLCSHLFLSLLVRTQMQMFGPLARNTECTGSAPMFSSNTPGPIRLHAGGPQVWQLHPEPSPKKLRLRPDRPTQPLPAV